MEKLRANDRKIEKYYTRKRRRRSNEKDKEEDKLSSLPDAILTDILSRLTIHSAATTSVLSHRWHRLWTDVTCVNVSVYTLSKSIAKIINILKQLNCRKLRHFNLTLKGRFNCPEIPVSESDSWFHEVRSRNVENIDVYAEYGTPEKYFSLPSFLFNSKFLVTLKVRGILTLPRNQDFCLHLPNLKKLSLIVLFDFPLWLETLIKSSSLLEDLNLVFSLDLSGYVRNIIASNLNSLSITMMDNTMDTRVYIDAPNLTNLQIKDWTSIYYFLRVPSTLLKACIELKRNYGYGYGYGLELEEDEQDINSLNGPRKEYMLQMIRFFGGLSSVSKLELKLQSRTNILRYINCVNLPIFSNLTHLETNCFKDLFLSLNCFPKLEHLVVRFFSDEMEQRSWCAPDSVADCLVSKLKTITIWGLKGIDGELRVLAYILSNAIVLKKIRIDFCIVQGEYVNIHNKEREKAYAVWKECQFCKSLLKLPRSSSTCDVVVSGRSVTASGNALQDSILTCQMYVGE